MKSNAPAYDIIGDIHGQYDKLAGLLHKLGYASRGDGYRHPDGRKVVFLGDYIDRGPKVHKVLVTIRAMVEDGDALAIMGNHEFNMVCYHIPDGSGGWLYKRDQPRDVGMRLTLAQFAEMPGEWADWLEWMKKLPLFLDLGDLRAVHACWDAKGIERLAGKTMADDSFLRSCVDRKSPEYRAVENVLNGPEMVMPEGYIYHDKAGNVHAKVRVRWWNLPDRARIGELVLPSPVDAPGDAPPHELKRVPNYPSSGPPVFFGHYWLESDAKQAPLASNLACLDFSAANEGPLVAYRWNGERELEAKQFLC